MREYWKRNGPPAHISLVYIAAQLGVDLLGTAGGSEAPDELEPVPTGPSILEVAAEVRAPVDGGDTLAASMEVLRRMFGE